MMENRKHAITRRQILATATLLGLSSGKPATAAAPKLKIGVPDWTLKLSAKIESFALAARIGFAGVEVSMNQAPNNSGRLELFDQATCRRFIAESKRQGVAIASTRINGFSRDLEPGTAAKFLAEGSRVTAQLGASVMLAPCFGIAAQADLDRMGRILREAAPAAEEAGAIIALEDSNTAPENVRMMEQSGSDAVKVFYDIGNCTRYGYNIIDEIRWLGIERICQYHLKDTPADRLGKGTVDFTKTFETIAETGYEAMRTSKCAPPMLSSGNWGKICGSCGKRSRRCSGPHPKSPAASRRSRHDEPTPVRKGSSVLT